MQEYRLEEDWRAVAGAAEAVEVQAHGTVEVRVGDAGRGLVLEPGASQRFLDFRGKTLWAKAFIGEARLVVSYVGYLEALTASDGVALTDPSGVLYARET